LNFYWIFFLKGLNKIIFFRKSLIGKKVKVIKTRIYDSDIKQ